nr:hypothetical protein CFP56_34971 [Quercus suber]
MSLGSRSPMMCLQVNCSIFQRCFTARLSGTCLCGVGQQTITAAVSCSQASRERRHELKRFEAAFGWAWLPHAASGLMHNLCTFMFDHMTEAAPGGDTCSLQGPGTHLDGNQGIVLGVWLLPESPLQKAA